MLPKEHHAGKICLNSVIRLMLEKVYQVVLIEDDPGHSDLVKMGFETFRSYRLHHFWNITDATSFIERTPPDLIYTDVELPEGSIIPILRQNGWAQRFPVVVLTAHGNESIAVELMKLGVRDYFAKNDNVLVGLGEQCKFVLREWEHEMARRKAESALKLSQEELLRQNEQIQRQNTNLEQINEELKLTNQRLSESEARFRSISEQSILGICISRKNYIHYRNSAFSELMNWVSSEEEYSLDELIKKVHPDDKTALSQYLKEKTIREGSTVYRLLDPRQELIWVEQRSKQITYEGDSAQMHIFIDITQKKRTEEELVSALKRAEESDRLKTAFLANMSHEIRTPMNSILGFAQLLEMDEDITDKQKRHINVINNNAHRLLNLMNDIIDISKIESEQLTISKSPFSINQLLQKVYNEFEYRKKEAGKSHIKLVVTSSLDDNDCTIRSDEQKIRRVLENLLDNAFKFTEKGFIEFGYSLEIIKQNAYLQFFVTDTGIGIEEDDQNAIFDIFRQADESYTRRFGGTGLGLAVCRGILKLLGGTIWVSSMPNQGASFYFTIPFESIKLSAQKGFDDDDPVADWEGKTILVVEDDHANARYLEVLIQKYQATFLLAKTGIEAVEMVRQNELISLILMDIHLPELNGYEATRKIKSIRPDLPIIAQTANAMDGDRKKSIDAGCDDYLAKPIRKEELVATLNRFFTQPDGKT